MAIHGLDVATSSKMPIFIEPEGLIGFFHHNPGKRLPGTLQAADFVLSVDSIARYSLYKRNCMAGIPPGVEFSARCQNISSRFFIIQLLPKRLQPWII